MIIETFGCKYQVGRSRDIHTLQVLLLCQVGAVFLLVRQVVEHEVARAEIHGRCQSEGKVFRYACLCQHTHRESCIPAHLVASDRLLHTCAVIVGDDLRSYVLKLHVLQMRTHEHTEVQRPQVDVRLVLHTALLGHCLRGNSEDKQKENIRFLHYF